MEKIPDNVTLDILPSEQKDIARLIGLDAYLQLVRQYGGSQLYIAKADKIEAAIRDEKIREEFTGGNIHFLAIKYNLSERSIREIVSPFRTIEGQTSLF